MKKGVTASHIWIEIPAGARIMASITNEAVEELGLKVGEDARVVIKATSVMVRK